MTKVNQLLEKALSTQSEDEAISCLRLARKRHTGEAVNIKSTAAEQSKELYWREVAEKYFRIAQGYEKQATISRQLASEYMSKYTDSVKTSQQIAGEKRALEINLYIWRLISAFLFGIMAMVLII